MREIHRVLQPHGLLVLAVLAGEPDQGLPHVQLFSEAMLDQATARFVPLEKSLQCDRGCTGRQDYQVWFGVYQKADVPI
jgi:hypothetical protein